MPTRIEFPENYKHGDVLGGLLRPYMTDCSSTFAEVSLPVEQVVSMLNSTHAGLREDIADLTISIFDATPQPVG